MTVTVAEIIGALVFVALADWIARRSMARLKRNQNAGK